MNTVTQNRSSFPDNRARPGQQRRAIRLRMKQDLVAIYPDLTPESVSIDVSSKRHLFANSSHFRCLIRGRTDRGRVTKRYIYVKRSHQVEVEYLNLKSLWERSFRTDTVNRIPRPLDYWPQWNLLLSEYIPGQSPLLPWLFIYFSPLGGFADSLSANIRMQRIAKWLVAFQIGGEFTQREVPIIDDVVEAIDELGSTPYIRRETRKRATEWLSSASSTLRSTTPVPSHGDFAARNILQDRDSVTVVDWEKPLVKRHPLYDVQSFVINLERRLIYPLSSHQRVEKLKNAFLSAYLENAPFGINNQMLTITRIIALIHQLKAQYRASVRHPKSILKRRRTFIRYLLEEIETGIGLDQP